MAIALDADIDLDPDNEDIYDLLETTNNMVSEALNIVNNQQALMNHDMRQADPQNIDIYRLLMEHKARVLELRTIIEQHKHVFSPPTVSTSTQSDPIVPPAPAKVPQAKKEDIEPLLLDPTTKLGIGQFGDVYKGEYKGQVVALIHVNKQSEEANLEMVHELKMSHCYPADNIVPLYTYCEEPPCLVFQYMENGSLYDKLQDTEHPLTWNQRANIAVGIARGLYYLHANDVVHSAIKSRNILLDKHLEPKIAHAGYNKVLYNMTGKTDTQFDPDWIKSNLESDSEKVIEKKGVFPDEGSPGNGKIIQHVFSKDQIKEIEERCMKDANNVERKKNSSDSSSQTTFSKDQIKEIEERCMKDANNVERKKNSSDSSSQTTFSKDQIKEIEERCMKDANNAERKKNSSDSSSQTTFSKDQTKEIEERYVKDANNGERKKNSSDSSSHITENSINVPSFIGSPYYLPNWCVAYRKGKIVWEQMDVYSFGIVLLEIMSGKVPGYKWRDSSNKTLREFVNNDIINHVEPPTEYIDPVDDEQRRFKIKIVTELDGSMQIVSQDVDWAKILYDIGKQCTIYDQTPWKAPFKDPMPWRTMQENNITMENIFPRLENCYNYYRMQLDELGRRTPILEESDFVANQNQSQQMSS